MNIEFNMFDNFARGANDDKVTHFIRKQCPRSFIIFSDTSGFSPTLATCAVSLKTHVDTCFPLCLGTFWTNETLNFPFTKRRNPKNKISDDEISQSSAIDEVPVLRNKTQTKLGTLNGARLFCVKVYIRKNETILIISTCATFHAISQWNWAGLEK